MIKKTFFSLLILLLVAVAAAGYFYFQFRSLKNNPSVAADRARGDLIEKVGILILIPDEQPTIFDVTEPDKLSDKEFYANAKLGDKVLFFPIAKKIILYDPLLNKVINATYVTEEANAKSASTTQ